MLDGRARDAGIFFAYACVNFVRVCYKFCTNFGFVGSYMWARLDNLSHRKASSPYSQGQPQYQIDDPLHLKPQALTNKQRREGNVTDSYSPVAN
jgi:hypothetical protein